VRDSAAQAAPGIAPGQKRPARCFAGSEQDGDHRVVAAALTAAILKILLKVGPVTRVAGPEANTSHKKSASRPG